jgi:hypothetical protein
MDILNNLEILAYGQIIWEVDFPFCALLLLLVCEGRHRWFGAALGSLVVGGAPSSGLS